MCLNWLKNSWKLDSWPWRARVTSQLHLPWSGSAPCPLWPCSSQVASCCHHQVQWPRFSSLLPGLVAAQAAGDLTRRPRASLPHALPVSLLPLLHPFSSPGWFLSLCLCWMFCRSSGLHAGPPSFLSLGPVPCRRGFGHSHGFSGYLHPDGFQTFITRPHFAPDSAHQTYWPLTISTWIS